MYRRGVGCFNTLERWIRLLVVILYTDLVGGKS